MMEILSHKAFLKSCKQRIKYKTNLIQIIKRMLLTRKYIVWVAFFALNFSACKKWDDHTAITNPDLNGSLLQKINGQPNLSRFSDYLVKTGLDKELSSSKAYTVWAPTNDALQNLDAAIISDTAKLKQYLTNHIALTTYYTSNANTPVRVQMLNGKRVTFSGNSFDEATITEGDKIVGNGVLHIINKPVAPLPNAWELINNTTSTYQQSTFIKSLNFSGFDPSLAIVDSINSQTGQPIYRPGTGVVARNLFNDRVVDLKDESKQYTYFVLTNAALSNQITAQSPYFKTSTADSTYNLAAYNVVKDLAVEGMYTQANLPDTLVSKFGVKIPVDKSKIVETRKLSNGIMYVMSGINFSIEDKIQPITIQGEKPFAFLLDRRSTTYYRVRANPATGNTFNDLVVNNHGVSNYSITYKANNVNTTKYKVYWVAVNDFQSSTFQQRLLMESPTATTFPYVTVPLNNYNEVLLGEYTVNNFGTLDMYLTSANSTTNGVNSLTLDYIKLVPVF